MTGLGTVFILNIQHTQAQMTGGSCGGHRPKLTHGLAFFSSRDEEGNFIARGSYHNEVTSFKDPISSEYPSKYGHNFQEGLDRALEIDPNFIFITAWNDGLEAGSIQTRFPPGQYNTTSQQVVPFATATHRIFQEILSLLWMVTWATTSTTSWLLQ